jgi:hypothetical protein
VARTQNKRKAAAVRSTRTRPGCCCAPVEWRSGSFDELLSFEKERQEVKIWVFASVPQEEATRVSVKVE